MNSVKSKKVDVRLFFNRAASTFYVSMGKELLFIAPDKVVTRISEKEGIDIIHAHDVKEIQEKVIKDE